IFMQFLRLPAVPGDEGERLRLLWTRIIYRQRVNLPDIEDDLYKGVLKDSPAIQREVLLTLRNAPPDKAKKLILELAKQYDGKDRFYLEAIGIAVGRWDKGRRDVILKDFDKEFPEWNDKVADLVWELRPPSMMPALGKKLADPKLSAPARARIIDILAL